MIYLAGPITAKGQYSIEQNVAQAVDLYLHLISVSIHAFCPHLGGGFPSAFNVPYERWLEHDFRMIDMCDTMLMLPRWQTSDGARRENAYARERQTYIIYHDDPMHPTKRGFAGPCRYCCNGTVVVKDTGGIDTEFTRCPICYGDSQQ